MANLLFVDTTCPSPYSDITLRNAPLGGTEATVIRVAEGLACRGHSVTVAQHERTETFVSEAGVRYATLEDLPRRIDALVILRTAKTLPYFRDKYRGAKPLIWAHDYNENEFVSDYPILHKTGVKILCVSKTHSARTSGAFLSRTDPVGVSVGYIYNPVVTPGIRGETVRKKLVFFSSPHKGLERTLEVFQMLRNRDAAWTLTVANPGYYSSSNTSLEGVINLGCLPHHRVLEEVANASCVFHLNNVFPETFGLVYGEANQMGVPCITHNFGSAYEILGEGQVLDVRDTKTVIDRVEFFDAQADGLRIKPRPEFRLDQVLNRWVEVING